MGERLRDLRLRRAISQEEVARHIGITRSAYSHYEINNRQPVYDTLIKLAAFFNVSLDYIIGGTRPNAKSDVLTTPDTKEILYLLQTMNPEQRTKSLDMIADFMRRELRSGGSG
jgi:transcriptional regulator with XRE-family HTH domain